MHLEVFLRWYLVGFSALFGAAMLVWRNRFAAISCLVNTSQLAERDAVRVKEAIARREQLEALPGGSMAAIAPFGP